MREERREKERREQHARPLNDRLRFLPAKKSRASHRKECERGAISVGWEKKAVNPAQANTARPRDHGTRAPQAGLQASFYGYEATSF